VRLGLIVRCDRRGIAVQTAELHRHLRPAKTLCVLMGPDLTPYEERPGDFPGATTATYNGITGKLDDDALDWLLTDVDVVLTVETPYDWRVYEWGRERAIATVVHANPELYLHEREPSLPRPTLVVVPTTWRMDHMPGSVYMPMPVATDHLPFRQRTEATRFLHIAGHRAIHDRAGTDLVCEAIARVRPAVHLTIRARHQLRGHAVRMLRHVPNVDVVVDDLPDYADLYDGFDVLVHPRRYGGLSLPMQEAMALGMAVVATNREPERTILPAEALVAVESRRPGSFQPGRIFLENADPRPLGEMLGHLAGDPTIVWRLSEASGKWAAAHSWERLLPQWIALLERAVRVETVGVRVL
jgi:Glycosyl transferases group 1